MGNQQTKRRKKIKSKESAPVEKCKEQCRVESLQKSNNNNPNSNKNSSPTNGWIARPKLKNEQNPVTTVTVSSRKKKEITEISKSKKKEDKFNETKSKKRSVKCHRDEEQSTKKSIKSPLKPYTKPDEQSKRDRPPKSTLSNKNKSCKLKSKGFKSKQSPVKSAKQQHLHKSDKTAECSYRSTHTVKNATICKQTTSRQPRIKIKASQDTIFESVISVDSTKTAKSSHVKNDGSPKKRFLYSIKKVVFKEKSTKQQSSAEVQTKELTAMPKKSNIPFVVGDVQRPPKVTSPKVIKVETELFRPPKIDTCVLSPIDSKGSTELVSSSEKQRFTNGKTYLLAKSLSDVNELTPIFKEDFEQLYYKLKELNNAVKVLKHSYQSLIGSLVKLSRREKSQLECASEKEATMLTTISELKMKTESCDAKTHIPEVTARYNLPLALKSDMSQYEEEVPVDSRFAMEHFLNPLTREEAFQQLFHEIDALNEDFSRLKEFFDSDGDFLYQEYENSDYRIDRATFDMLKRKAQMLLTAVQQVTRIYNQDLLDMFRIR